MYCLNETRTKHFEKADKFGENTQGAPSYSEQANRKTRKRGSSTMKATCQPIPALRWCHSNLNYDVHY